MLHTMLPAWRHTEAVKGDCLWPRLARQTSTMARIKRLSCLAPRCSAEAVRPVVAIQSERPGTVGDGVAVREEEAVPGGQTEKDNKANAVHDGVGRAGRSPGPDDCALGTAVGVDIDGGRTLVWSESGHRDKEEQRSAQGGR